MTTPSSDPPDTTDLDESLLKIMADFEQAEEQRQEHAKTTISSKLRPALQVHHVARLEAVYSGCGDSGAIDELRFQDDVNQAINQAAIAADLQTSLEEALYAFLPAGFEINEGGQGVLRLDVNSGQLTLEHQENYTETRNSTLVWEVL